MSKFKVIGNHSIDGVRPGRTVTVDDPARARRLVRAGHLAPVIPKETPNGDVRSD